MDITPLEIELVRQKPGSDDALRACALMIFNHYGDPITKEELWKKLHVYKKHSGLSGSYLTDLGTLAQKRGYKTKIHHYDWSWWNENIQAAIKKGKKSTIKALNGLKSEKREWPEKKIVKKEVAYLRRKGAFVFSIPKLIDIDAYLMKKIPVIVPVQANYFFHQPNINFNHYILITGKKNGKYRIKDPLYALEEVDENELYYSWTKVGGWIIAIFPKEQPPQVKQSQLRF